MLMGLLRLGWLIRFISHSVISGFTTASAIMIGFSHVKYFLGWVFHWSLSLANLQIHIWIVISNPNRDVLLTFSRSGVVELIGKEWFFVRVHDAVQVCLPLVESLKETTKIAESSPNDASGFQKLPSSKEIHPRLEPLLSQQPSK
ncbi:sulfate transporter 4.1, chloroplastic-like [Cucurbita pepo subsp. pepo]|uniref:sulfate transporter 4.1, chloroplastic-like n=1 Tax=Cucurbita pepo subsp. pepo TaxID=3664 RepID=UPI000C9DA027|nr:sulfate transporter 4.1, chloroplastic-like [Cucurbita pepo subsp. pepo]